VKTCGDNTRFGEVVTLMGEMLLRAGRMTTRRCGVPSCAAVTDGELFTGNWSTENI